MLKEHEAGASVTSTLRRHAVAENTMYRWKSKLGGMAVSETKRLRELEQENARMVLLRSGKGCARYSRSANRGALFDC